VAVFGRRAGVAGVTGLGVGWGLVAGLDRRAGDTGAAGAGDVRLRGTVTAGGILVWAIAIQDRRHVRDIAQNGVGPVLAVSGADWLAFLTAVR
jgi:hypothetical protein